MEERSAACQAHNSGTWGLPPRGTCGELSLRPGGQGVFMAGRAGAAREPVQRVRAPVISAVSLPSEPAACAGEPVTEHVASVGLYPQRPPCFQGPRASRLMGRWRGRRSRVRWAMPGWKDAAEQGLGPWKVSSLQPLL